MNNAMIEAMSQFEIPRPILRSSAWPRRHRQGSGTGPLGRVSGRDSVMSTLRRDGRAQSNTATVRSAKAAYQPGRCNLTSHTSGFLRRINGVPLDVIPNRRPIDEVIEVFERWLILKDPTPLYAVLGAVAANLLPGDPVWLGLIAPPSSAKTEILNSLVEACPRLYRSRR